MKLGILGDIHFTNHCPEKRTDDFWVTMQRKFEQALKIFKDENCNVVIQPGDLVDTPHVSNIIISYIINALKGHSIELYMVFGQHDILGHSETTLPSSPLSVLSAAGVVNILTDKYDWQNSKRYSRIKPGTEMAGVPQVGEVQHISFYGAGFGQEIPKPKSQDDYNILVIHSDISDIGLWPGHEFTKAENFLRLNPEYNLVICGDVHRRFMAEYKGRKIINAGPLTRDTAAEHIRNHIPAVVIFDTETDVTKTIPLDIEPIDKVFDLTQKPKRDNDAINRLIEGLKSGNKKSAGWKEILIRVLKEKNSSPEAQKLIDEFMESINVNK